MRKEFLDDDIFARWTIVLCDDTNIANRRIGISSKIVRKKKNCKRYLIVSRFIIIFIKKFSRMEEEVQKMKKLPQREFNDNVKVLDAEEGRGGAVFRIIRFRSFSR